MAQRHEIRLSAIADISLRHLLQEAFDRVTQQPHLPFAIEGNTFDVLLINFPTIAEGDLVDLVYVTGFTTELIRLGRRLVLLWEYDTNIGDFVLPVEVPTQFPPNHWEGLLGSGYRFRLPNFPDQMVSEKELYMAGGYVVFPFIANREVWYFLFDTADDALSYPNHTGHIGEIPSHEITDLPSDHTINVFY